MGKSVDIVRRCFTAMIGNSQRVSDSLHRAMNLKTLVTISALLLSLAMVFIILYWPSSMMVLALFAVITCCILIIIEPFYGLCIFILLVMIHPEQSFPSLVRLHLHDSLGGVTIASWFAHSMVEKRKIFVKCPQTFLILGLYLAMVVSSIGAVDPDLSKNGLHTFLILFLICFMMLSMADTKERIRIITWMPLIAGLYLSYRTMGIRASYATPLDASWMNRDYGWTNSLSMLMVTLIPISWSMVFGETRRPYKIAAAFACVLYTITNIKTMSRGGFISFGIVVIFMMITAPKKMRIPSVVMALILIILIPLKAPRGYFDEMNTIITYSESKQDMGRIELMKRGLDIFEASPISGVGLNNFPLVSGNVASHNTYVQVLAELGLFGFLFFSAFIIFTFWDNWKVSRMLKGRDEHRFFYLLSQGLQISMVSLLFRFFFINALHLNIIYMIFILSRLIRTNAEKECAGIAR